MLHNNLYKGGHNFNNLRDIIKKQLLEIYLKNKKIIDNF